MSQIIKQKDNDKEYIFTCPVCGTIFTERERNIEKQEWDYGYIGEYNISVKYISRCPNCNTVDIHQELEEYDKNKDYE